MHSRPDSDNLDCFQILFRNRGSLSYPGFDKKIKKQHFPQMKPKVFSNMLSRIFGWFEDWFAIEAFKEEEYQKEIALIKGYNQKGLFKLANRHYDKIKAKIKNANELDIVNNQALFELHYNQYYSTNPIKSKNGTKLFEDTVESYLKNTKNQALLLVMEAHNNMKVTGSEYHADLTKINSIIQHIDDTELTPFFNLAIQGFRNDNLTSTFQLMEELQSGKLNESSELYTILTSYLGRISNQLCEKGKLSKNSIVADAQNLRFRAIVKNKHQKLLPTLMFNSVNILSNFQDYSSTSLFIDKWIDKVHTTYPDSSRRYCQALNAFAHDRYEEIPQLLNSLEFENVDQKIVSAILMIIAYYKLEEEDLLETLIKNFIKQLKRNSKNLSKILYKANDNFIKVIVLLQKSKYDSTIKIDADNYKPLTFKTWVLKELKIRSL